MGRSSVPCHGLRSPVHLLVAELRGSTRSKTQSLDEELVQFLLFFNSVGCLFVYERVLKLLNVFWVASQNFEAITWTSVKQVFHKPPNRYRSSCSLEVCLRLVKLWQPLATRVRVISWWVCCLGFPELWNLSYAAVSWVELCLLQSEK